MAALGFEVTVPASASRTVGITNGSSVVTDTSAVAADAGRAITGTGIPAGAVVGNVTASTGYNLYNPSENGTTINATATNASLSATLGGILLFQLFDGTVWAEMQSLASTYPLLPQYLREGDKNSPLPLWLFLPSASTIYLGGSNVTSSSTHIGALVTAIAYLSYLDIGGDSLFAVIATSTATASVLALRQ